MTEAQGSVGQCPFSTPYGRDDLVDPPAELMRVSAEEPITRVQLLNGETGWLTSNYELARSVLTDRRFSAQRLYGRQPFGDLERWLAEGRAEEGRPPHLNESDPPEHTRRRRSIMSHLTVHRVQERGDEVQAIVDDCLDAMEEAGSPTDFMEHFARPMPALVLCELFGVPAEDRELIVDLTDLIRDPEVGVEEIGPAIEQFYDYVEGVVADRRQNLGDDMLSELIRSGDLSHDELVKDAIGIFQAGHETTTTQLGYTLWTLLDHRERWEALKADPATIDGLVEESLRYLTIIDANGTERTALEDIELGGVTVEKGETVVVASVSANRDPKRFDHPDTFDPSRDARGHLAFGYGIHMCAGQHVARLELRLAFTSLAQRFPNLSLAGAPEEIEWLADLHQMSGPTKLPVFW